MPKQKQKSLMDRFALWWESDDNDRLVAREFEHHHKDMMYQDVDENISIDLKKFELDEWTKQRLKVLKILWGKDVRIPGDEEFNIELFHIVGMDSKTKILDMSVGLGNCARIMARDCFAHIDVIEAYPNLLPYFVDSIKRENLESFISILQGDLSEVKLQAAKYNLIYGRESMFKIKDKGFVLDKCIDALASHGHIIFTDFILSHGNKSFDVYEKWSEREKSTVYPVSKGAYTRIFNRHKVKLYPTMDYTKQYVNFVNLGWMKLEKYIQQNEYDDEFVDVMAQESELWLSRVRALRSGNLKLLRFHATLQK